MVGDAYPGRDVREDDAEEERFAGHVGEDRDVH